MSQYLYRVAICAASFDNDATDPIPSALEPKQCRTVTGVFVNRTGIATTGGGASPLPVTPINMAGRLVSNDDYAITTAGGMFTQLATKPAIPRETPLDNNALVKEIRIYNLSKIEARKNGRDYDASATIFQLIRGDLLNPNATLFVLVNRVETTSCAIYRGNTEQLKTIWQGTQAELATAYDTSRKTVTDDAAYVDRYVAKWDELRQANITDMLPELARKDGVLLMTPEQLANWQQRARYAIAPTPAQVEAALN